jgi:hypothetical protein
VVVLKPAERIDKLSNVLGTAITELGAEVDRIYEKAKTLPVASTAAIELRLVGANLTVIGQKAETALGELAVVE